VVVVAFQIAFRAEIHVNDVFLFFKNYFWYQHIKTIQKIQTALNFSKKINKLKFDQMQVQPQSQTGSKEDWIVDKVEVADLRGGSFIYSDSTGYGFVMNETYCRFAS
jgi:hypothetical protein